MFFKNRINKTSIQQINFDLKNEDEAKKEVLKSAYEDAFKQAKIIAEDSLKELKEYKKVDFKSIKIFLMFLKVIWVIAQLVMRKQSEVYLKLFQIHLLLKI